MRHMIHWAAFLIEFFYLVLLEWRETHKDCERPGQIFALANGDRVKANQRGKIAFVVDMDKKHTAEQLLKKLSAHHKDLLIQVFADAVLVVYHLYSI